MRGWWLALVRWWLRFIGLLLLLVLSSHLATVRRLCSAGLGECQVAVGELFPSEPAGAAHRARVIDWGVDPSSRRDRSADRRVAPVEGGRVSIDERSYYFTGMQDQVHLGGASTGDGCHLVDVDDSLHHC